VPEITVETLLVAPVPVGHRVRITFFQLVGRGLFGRGVQDLPHEPLIEDLDTGVSYASERPFPHPSVKEARVPLPIEASPSAEVDRVVTGVVRSCRVTTVRGFAEVDVQTVPIVEVP
jgi:hypothetical protein